MNYIWRDTLYSRAVGLDYERLRGSFAYFNLLMYKAIEYCACRGLDRLHLGLATAAKLERGAVAAPLWTAVIPVAQPAAAPGLRLVDSAGMESWRDAYRHYGRAFPAASWQPPRR